MIKVIKRYLGRGEFSITVPPMDGALMPNELLEESEKICSVEAPDCLALMNGQPVVSSRSRILYIDDPEKEVGCFDSEITCLTNLPDGGLVVALSDGRIVILPNKGQNHVLPLKEKLRCITAMQADGADRLWVTQGSSQNDYRDWKRDLMEKKRLRFVMVPRFNPWYIHSD